jgi:molecular chaperone HscB
MNYFELFEMPVSLSIDAAVLNKKYVELQKKYHPDFFTQDNEAAQEEALEISAEINKALKVLRNQDATIFYVLNLKGIAEKDEKYQLPPDFLMEVMELNEQLSADSAAAIAAFEKNIHNEVSAIIAGYDDSAVSKENLLKLKEYYYKKKYLQRILDRIDG